MHGESTAGDTSGCSALSDVHGEQVCVDPEGQEGQALSVGPDVGTPVSLQFGMCGLREDSVSRSCPGPSPDARAVLEGGGGVWCADREYPGRRAADPSRNGPDREGVSRTEEVCVLMHECDSAGEEIKGVYAFEIFYL